MSLAADDLGSRGALLPTIRRRNVLMWPPSPQPHTKHWVVPRVTFSTSAASARRPPPSATTASSRCSCSWRGRESRAEISPRCTEISPRFRRHVWQSSGATHAPCGTARPVWHHQPRVAPPCGTSVWHRPPGGLQHCAWRRRVAPPRVVGPVRHSTFFWPSPSAFPSHHCPALTDCGGQRRRQTWQEDRRTFSREQGRGRDGVSVSRLVGRAGGVPHDVR